MDPLPFHCRVLTGTEALPPTCLGHIGYAVVPWKRGRGYATRALAMLLPEARKEGVKIAREMASEADLQMRMQGIVLLGAFLKLTPYARESQMDDQHVYEGVEKALRKYFGKRGDRVVQDNLDCVKRGYGDMKEIPPAVMNA